MDQEKLIEALERLRVPQIMIAVLIFNINRQNRVKDIEGKPDYWRQNAGNRQGCPLSPYLFICLMSLMFHDIHENIENTSQIGQ